MDPFDEFEFKPLTQGLGFHKKRAKLKEESSSLSDGELKPAVVPPLFEGLPKEDVPSAKSLLSEMREDLASPAVDPLRERRNYSRKRSAPLPRKSPVEGAPAQSQIFGSSKTASAATVGYNPSLPLSTTILDKLPSASTKDQTRKGSPQSPRRVRLQMVPCSLSAALLDGILIFALSLMFVASLLFVTDLNLATVLSHIQVDRMTQASLALLLFAVWGMYMVLSRSFFGASLGEWAFDLQLGQDGDQKKLSYPFRVLARMVIQVVTGFVFLPLLSIIFRRDLAGTICGLSLYGFQS